MKKNELTRKIRIRIIVLSILLFLVTITGITYAYFSIQVTGNETASSIIVSTARLSLIYTDTLLLGGDRIKPEWTQSKTISVENNGTVPVYYNIIWRDLLNEITDDELVISGSCSTNASGRTCGDISETTIPTETTLSHNILIKNNIEIEVGEIHTYTITVTFKDTGSNQNYNQNKEFYGTLNIAEGNNNNNNQSLQTTSPNFFTYNSRYSTATYNINYDTCQSYVQSLGYSRSEDRYNYCHTYLKELLLEGMIDSEQYSNFGVSNVSLSEDGGIVLTGFNGIYTATYDINQNNCRSYIESWEDETWTSQTINDFCAGNGADPYDSENLEYWLANDWIIEDEYEDFGLSNVNIMGRDIVIPSQIDGHNVTAIAEQAFLEKNLTSVFIPNTVVSIGNGAFASNSLSSVIIDGKDTSYSFEVYASNLISGTMWGWAGDITCVPDNYANVENGCITYIPHEL